jgi:hypothetical protein
MTYSEQVKQDIFANDSISVREFVSQESESGCPIIADAYDNGDDLAKNKNLNDPRGVDAANSSILIGRKK